LDAFQWAWPKFLFAVAAGLFYILSGAFVFLKLLYDPNKWLPSRKTLTCTFAVAGCLSWWPWRIRAQAAAAPKLARFLAEHEIFDPEPQKPSRNQFYDREDYSEAKQNWRRGARRKWRKSRRQALRELLRQTIQAGKDVAFGEQIITHAVNLNVKNLAHIDSKRDKVLEYFVALRRFENYLSVIFRRPLPKAATRRFISNFEVLDGYMAPIFLIAGLMTRFNEEWKPIIEQYDKSFSKSDRHRKTRELIELQAFEFYCWLLWGPSIPMCSCPAWRTSDEDQTQPLVFQYGFGDENNSITVHIGRDHADGAAREFGHKIAVPSRPVLPGRTYGPAEVHAYPAAIRGKVVAFSIDDAQKAIPQVQLGEQRQQRITTELVQIAYAVPGTTRNGEAGAAQTLARGDRKGEGDVGRPLACSAAGDSKYYSAYVWIMFVITDANGQPLYKLANEKWKNLLPFFQHANIADASTYLDIKKNLAAKSVAAIERFLTQAQEPDSLLMLHYACAFDDCNHGSSSGQPDLLFPPLQEISIKELLLRAIEQADPDRRLKWSRVNLQGRVDGYSAADLPKIIENWTSTLIDAN
jgi:hypothetical protein